MARASRETGIICLTVICMLSNKCKKIFTFIFVIIIIYLNYYCYMLTSLCDRSSYIICPVKAHRGPIKQYIHIDDLRFGRIRCEQF